MEEMAGDFSEAEGVRLSDYFEGRRDEVLVLTRALVETESPSGDVAGSRAVVNLLVEAAESIGAITSIERIESVGYGEHLRLCAFGTPGVQAAGTTLLVGHTDTVHPRGSLDERPWRVEENRVYAPGIFDMKANCALALEALRACSQLGLRPRGEVVLVLTCDEETGSATGRALVEKEAARAATALVLEPPASGGRVKTGRKGTGIFELSVTGKAAHAGLEPEKGASAILELARQIERLHALNDPARGLSVNVGVIEGGTRSNVVAATARAEIDLRFGRASDGESLAKAILHPTPFDGRVQLRVSGGINRPPLERNEKVLRVYELAKGIAARLGFELGETEVGGASDGNFIAALGVPVLDGLGIEGDGAHANHEHILIDGIARRGALIAWLIATL